MIQFALKHSCMDASMKHFQRCVSHQKTNEIIFDSTQAPRLYLPCWKKIIEYTALLMKL